MGGKLTSDSRAVGADLAAVLPRNAPKWWQRHNLRKLNLILCCTMLFVSTLGYDNSMMNGLQALEPWKSFMDQPTGAYFGIINAMQALGSTAAYPLMSVAADRWGRKISVYIGYAMLIPGVAIQTGAVNPAMFICGRFLVGAASAFFGAIPVLLAETAYPTHRGKLTAGYNSLYYLGSLIAAWTTFGTRNYGNDWAWRTPSIVQIAIPIFCIVPLILCPESPRWLVSVGRTEEARKILVKYHAEGDADSPLVAFEMIEIEQAWNSAKGVGYMDMLKTRGNRHRLLISISLGTFSQWNGVSVVAYYLPVVLATAGVTSVTDQTLINGFLQLWNLIVASIASSQIDRIGRRDLFLTSTVGMFISYAVITGLSGSFATTQHTATGIAVVPMLFVFYGFFNLAWNPLQLAYPTEIWQYQFRSRGVAVTLIATFLSIFLSVLLNPIAFQSIGWKYYIVYIGILLWVFVTVYFLYPETRGHSLEEMEMLFDGEQEGIDPSAILTLAVGHSLEGGRIEGKLEGEPEVTHDEAVASSIVSV